jgi:signal transduction histidine kinase
MKKADIHECLDSTLLLLENRLQTPNNNIQIIKQYGNVPQFECYPSQLNQVFMNTINNAIEALESLENGDTNREKIIRITTEVIDDQKVAIHITDNGPGIAPDVLSRLFDPFFTTKPIGKGTGLGLSISYQIVVERHRGDLRCISNPGESTEFIIELPLSRPPGS